MIIEVLNRVASGMHIFDYSFLQNGLLPAGILNITTDIYCVSWHWIGKINSLTPISKVDIGKILPDVSATTVEAVLGQMVRTGSIRKVGSGRETKYVRN